MAVTVAFGDGDFEGGGVAGKGDVGGGGVVTVLVGYKWVAYLLLYFLLQSITDNMAGLHG